MTDKKTIALVALLSMILVGYHLWITREFGGAVPAPNSASEQGLVEETPEAASAPAESEAPTGPSEVPAPTQSAPPGQSGGWVEADQWRPEFESSEHPSITISNDVIQLAFSPVGAGIRKAELTQYNTQNNGGGPLIMDQWPILPFSLSTSNRDVFEVIKADTTGITMQSGADPDRAYSIRKEFVLREDYILDATITFTNDGTAPVLIDAFDMHVGVAHHTGPEDKQYGGMLGFDYYNGKSVDYLKLKQKKGVLEPPFEARQDSVIWAGVKNKYFTVILSPGLQIGAQADDLQPSGIFTRLLDQSEIERTGEGVAGSIRYPAQTLAPGETATITLYSYVGPKNYRVLNKLPNHEGLIMQFGLFGWLSKRLIDTLTFFHKLTLSWGLAIVLLTILVKGIFWPFTHKATLSMRQMQDLQPKINALKEKYKTDQKRLQQEIMALYKEKGVNPLGGCLPYLFQLPVFWALFTTLRSAVELRGASFLWVQDLSTPDTVMVIPKLFLGNDLPINPLAILMGLTMFLQQKSAPTSPGMDPAQRRMMTYMPLVFFFMFYSFPAGLTLYWTVNQVLTIAQQLWTQKRSSAAPAKA
ncbi:MAG: membrane protein insertase YidC [Verrucomicrobiota bacterium]|jgi:YidC/Oxa1 family membrane protein insertase|nr:membrane protein insertase YidC [Verrucomicrobiota bacterium]